MGSAVPHVGCLQERTLTKLRDSALVYLDFHTLRSVGVLGGINPTPSREETLGMEKTLRDVKEVLSSVKKKPCISSTGRFEVGFAGVLCAKKIPIPPLGSLL